MILAMSVALAVIVFLSAMRRDAATAAVSHFEVERLAEVAENNRLQKEHESQAAMTARVAAKEARDRIKVVERETADRIYWLENQPLNEDAGLCDLDCILPPLYQ